MPEIHQYAPHAVFVPRKGEVNAWDNEDFVKTVRATGRKQIVLAGVVTDVCVAFPALSAIEAGQAITVTWRSKPVFIRHRTEAEIEAARAVPLAELKDRLARNENLADNAPATDENRAVPGRPQWLIQVGICTHLGCVPLGQGGADPKGEWGGWFCPCHGSHYDTAGRIRKGPAPDNLLIPQYEFQDDTTVRIG